MPKVKISEYSATANSNTDVASINIDEGCAPSGINNAIRAIMGHLKDFQSGTSNDPFTVGSSGSLTLSYGTANGVAYLNGSKAVTSGSALVFDGTSLGVGGAPASKLDVSGTVRSTTQTAPTSGAGMELFYDTGGAVGYLLAYDRTGAVYKQMNLGASLYTFGIAGSTAMTINASGNLGIGVTSPTQKLQVAGKIAVSGTNPSIQQTVQNAFLDLCGGTTVGTDPAIQIAGSTTTSDANKIFYNANTHLFRSTSGGSTYATIDTSGNLLVGDTTTIGTGGKFQVTSSTDTSLFKCTSSTTYAAIVSNVENTAARLMAFQYGSGGSPTNVGTITTNGTGVTYGTSSDYRLKENIVPMVGALDKVAQLKPVTYKWKINGSDGQGFIAHELAEVVPDAVQGAKDAIDADGNPTYQGIDTSYLVATLTAAIQELKAEFDAYKASHP